MINIGKEDSERVLEVKEFLLQYGYISKNEYEIGGLVDSYSQNEIRLLFGNIRVYYIKISDTIMYYDFNTDPMHNIVNNDYDKFKKNKHRTTILKRLVG